MSNTLVKEKTCPCGLTLDEHANKRLTIECQNFILSDRYKN